MADIEYVSPYPNGWQNRPNTTTPPSAQALQTLDDGIKNATEQANLALNTVAGDLYDTGVWS